MGLRLHGHFHSAGAHIPLVEAVRTRFGVSKVWAGLEDWAWSQPILGQQLTRATNKVLPEDKSLVKIRPSFRIHAGLVVPPVNNRRLHSISGFASRLSLCSSFSCSVDFPWGL